MNKILIKIISSILLLTMVFYTLPVLAYTKDETVYSDLNSKGEVYKTIVSTHLKNDEKNEVLNDISDLLNIENTNGEEELKKDGNNLIWKADGKDIYYQGETKKELPIDVNVKYELNGEEISAEEIVGKSGNVKITLEYTNKEEHIVNINGKYEKLYTPFVVVCGTTIQNENNTDIKITNGKVINDGTKTIVLGIAMPGIEKSLGISKLEIPNNVEISMKTDSFELNNIITYITPKIIEKNDLEEFNKLDELYSKVNTIKDASNKIEEGANELKDGTNIYSEKSQEFNSALNEFSNGINTANNSYTQIDNGINTLNESSSKLNLGTNQITNGTNAISQGIEEVDSNLENVKLGINGLSMGETQIQQGLEQIQKSIPDDVTSQIESLNTLKANNQATINLLTGVNKELKGNLELINKEETETITKLNTQIVRNNNVIQKLQEANNTIDKKIESLTNIPSSMQILKAGIEEVKNGVSNLKNGTDELLGGVSKLKEGTEILTEKSKELYQGTKTLNEGTQELVVGTSTLNNGSNQMKNGLNTLSNSGSLILNANKELTKGAKTLSDGANTLYNGINTFNKEAINTIVNKINGNVKDIQTRVEKLQELANEYNNFTMLNEGTNSEVKFIMIMDSIKKQEQQTNKQEIILNEKQSD